MTALALLLTLVLSLVLAPSPSHAQAGAKMPRIGILTPAFDPHSPFEAFRQGLRDLGYVEGQSIALEYRFAEGKAERLPALAAELVRLKVDVIVADAGAAARAAQHATETMPIVCTAFRPGGSGVHRQPGAAGREHHGVELQRRRVNGETAASC